MTSLGANELIYNLAQKIRQQFVLTLEVLKLEYSDNWVNTMAADALAPQVARSSATMVLDMQDKLVFCLPKGMI